jgi:hypothetical protein
MATNKTSIGHRGEQALATIFANPALQRHLIDRILELISNQTAGEETEGSVMASLLALAPRNYLEATLAVQLIAVQDAGLEGLRRAAAAGDKQMDVRDTELRHAEKLLNLFTRLLADYEKRRRHEAMGGAPALTF